MKRTLEENCYRNLAGFFLLLQTAFSSVGTVIKPISISPFVHSFIHSFINLFKSVNEMTENPVPMRAVDLL